MRRRWRPRSVKVYNPYAVRVKLQAYEPEALEKVRAVLEEAFPDHIASPVLLSDGGGVHQYITIRLEEER